MLPHLGPDDLQDEFCSLVDRRAALGGAAQQNCAFERRQHMARYLRSSPWRAITLEAANCGPSESGTVRMSPVRLVPDEPIEHAAICCDACVRKWPIASILAWACVEKHRHGGHADDTMNHMGGASGPAPLPGVTANPSRSAAWPIQTAAIPFLAGTPNFGQQCRAVPARHPCRAGRGGTVRHAAP
jgi:hypothetical protein